MRNRWTLPVASGNKPADFVAKLNAQQTAIRSVTVDNTNSPLNVLVYSGASPEGIPYKVVAGRAATIAITQTSSVYFQFGGTADKDAGPIYLSVSDEDVENIPAYWVGIKGVDEGVTIPVSGDLEIDTSTPLDVTVVNPQTQPIPVQGYGGTGTPVSVSGVVGITGQPIWTEQQGPIAITPSPLPVSVPSPLPVQSTGVVASQITGPFPLSVDLSQTNPNPNNPITVAPNPVQYPTAGSGNRINSFFVLSFTATSTLPVQLLTPPSTTQAAYFTVIYIWGMDRQPTVEWNFQGRNNQGALATIMRGWGDKTLNFSGPYFMCPILNVNQGIYFNFANANAIIGGLQVRVMLMGWWA